MLKSFIILIILNFSFSNAQIDDLYSSITALEKIFPTDLHLIQNLQSYVKLAENKIEKLKSQLEEMYEFSLNHNHSTSFNNSLPTDEPLAKYAGTNYLVQLKQRFDNVNNDNIELMTVLNITNSGFTFPYYRDLDGVTLGLLRIQEYYNFTAHDIVSGNILNKGIKSAKMSSSDCFEIGLRLYGHKSYKESSQWFKEALDLYPQETSKIKTVVKKSIILDYLSYTIFESDPKNIDTLKEALEYNRQSLELEPNVEHVKRNREHFELILDDLIHEKMFPYEMKDFEIESVLMRQMCQGLIKKTPVELRQLYCKYEQGNHPFLKLAPFKVEMANLDPFVAIFYDVIYDSEIEILKNISSKHLVRAGTWNEERGEGEISETRTSKFAWLNDEMHPVLETINQRMSDISGMSMEGSEILQVMNYGIGGHYDVHGDAFPEPDGNSNSFKPYVFFEQGNRIATMLFYMSDVEQGGKTVFPWIKTSIAPVKGAAALWTNTFSNGKTDKRTRHSGCPVISGSKWVANKWIRSRAQTFLKKCKLVDDSYEFEIQTRIVQIRKDQPLLF